MDNETFLRMPGTIKAKETEILNKAQRLKELEFVMDKYRLNQLQAIADMKEGDKAIFSNNDKRQAELSRILSLDHQYKTYIEESKQLDQDVKIGEIELGFQKRLFRAVETIKRGELDVQ